MSTTAGRRFVTVEELAAYLRVGRTKAYQLVASGAVPRLKVGREWRVPIEELERQLRE
jgi:excisionase family DNA binding protein